VRTLSTRQVSITAAALLLATSAWTSVQAAGADARSAAPAAGEAGKNGAHGGDVYGVVNLISPISFTTLINARGQVAFEYVALETGRLNAGFFDGERLVDILPPNHATSSVSSLNDKGQIAFVARLIYPGDEVAGAFQPFRWTPGRGPVRLPSLNTEEETFLGGINNRGEIVGISAIGPENSDFRATRWTADNRLLPLPGLPGVSQSSASDINERNTSIGSGYDANRALRVHVWDAIGRPAPLALGTPYANASFINNRGDITGMLDGGGPDFRAYLWSPVKGVVRIGSNTVPSALSESGNVVGRRLVSDLVTHAFLYSRARGLVNLHPAASVASEALDVNDNGVVVGLVRPSDPFESRAYRWSPGGAAIDLNTRLSNPPAGLVLTEARAISPSGDIVADSNAGLVLLRRNGGTDAPVLGPIQVSSNRPNVPVQLTLSFRDRNPGDTHTATIDWGDGRGPQAATVRESRGRGEVHGEVVFPSEGGFAVVVSVNDSASRSTVVRQQIDVFVSGPNIATAAKQSPAKVADGTRTKATTYGWKGGEHWAVRERALQRKPK